MGRPANFDINAAHTLARGLKFAHLGKYPKLNNYYDDSYYHSSCILTAMDKYTAWKWEPMLNRWSVVIQGTKGQSIRINNTNIGVMWTGITVACWVYHHRLSGETEACFSKFWDGTNRCFSLWTHSGFGWTCSTDTVNNTSGTTDIVTRNLNEWYHIVGTWSSQSDMMKLFVNGQFVSQASRNGSFVRTNLAIIRLGSAPYGIGFTGSSTYASDITVADPMIWDRALSAQEIKILAHKHDYTLGGLIV